MHYTWLNRLLPRGGLFTTDGKRVEVISPGIHNSDAGPDFICSVVKIDGVELAGSVEIHSKSSDWNAHGHDSNPAYANVVLHVVGEADAEVRDCNGRVLPQLVVKVPKYVEDNYAQLLAEEKYPPCYRHAASLPEAKVESWLATLQTERLESKVGRILDCLARCGGDWEHVCFITIARSFGFGINGDAFEEWAYLLPLSAAGKHRDNIFQIEAMFMGVAGLLNESAVPEKYREQAKADGYFDKMAAEYRFLAHKFSLTEMPMEHWRLLRTRPQNFPHIRLSQLASLYVSGAVSMSSLLEPGSPAEVSRRFETGVTEYWRTHYLFGSKSRESSKRLRGRSLQLLVLNSVVPLLFAYGRYRGDKSLEGRALELMSALPPEENFITRTWREVGIEARSAADSQALIHLKRNYCDRRDCLRCRFGYEYLASGNPYKISENNDNEQGQVHL